jgi:hypothetical protein
MRLDYDLSVPVNTGLTAIDFFVGILMAEGPGTQPLPFPNCRPFACQGRRCFLRYCRGYFAHRGRMPSELRSGSPLQLPPHIPLKCCDPKSVR